MFDVILDPDARGRCTVWTGDKVSTLKGDIREVCDEIRRRVMVPKETPNGYKWIQVKTIGIDSAMCGRAYIYEFDDMGIKYTEIKPLNIDEAFPRLS